MLKIEQNKTTEGEVRIVITGTPDTDREHNVIEELECFIADAQLGDPEAPEDIDR